MYTFSRIEPLVADTARVTDPSVLTVDPMRVDMVQLERSQTLAEFALQFPSAVPVDQLAVLNHVESSATRLAAGTLVKGVI